jgi:hypothetical protein
MNIEIHFGALAPRLSKQDAGAYIKKKTLSHLQRDADALVRLHLRGVLSDSEVEKARRRLMNKIVNAAETKQ